MRLRETSPMTNGGPAVSDELMIVETFVKVIIACVVAWKIPGVLNQAAKNMRGE